MSTPAQPQKPKDLSSPETLIQMITGFWISQAIYAAAKLGIADLVQEGPKPCEEPLECTGGLSIASCGRLPVLVYLLKVRTVASA